MVVWSSFSRCTANLGAIQRVSALRAAPKLLQNAVQVREMSDHGPKMFRVLPSRFQWNKFKDLFHFYLMLGVIPITVVIFYANIFVGPATLTEIPKDYTPKHWEYHRHPISRFIAKYLQPSPQESYEKMCHHLYEEKEKGELRRLERDVRAKMAERHDYQAYYYRPAFAKYHRISKETADYLKSVRGDD